MPVPNNGLKRTTSPTMPPHSSKARFSRGSSHTTATTGTFQLRCPIDMRRGRLRNPPRLTHPCRCMPATALHTPARQTFRATCINCGPCRSSKAATPTRNSCATCTSTTSSSSLATPNQLCRQCWSCFHPHCHCRPPTSLARPPSIPPIYLFSPSFAPICMSLTLFNRL